MKILNSYIQREKSVNFAGIDGILLGRSIRDMFSYLKLFASFFTSDLFVPGLLVVVYVVFLIVVRGIIPSGEEFVEIFSGLYARYGYEIILVAAFLESLVLVNFFVPGQVAMALGAVFARTGQTDLVLVVLTASLGAVLGYLLDFCLGLYGFSEMFRNLGYGRFLDKARWQLAKTGKFGLAVGFVQTNVGSFLSFAAGAGKFNIFEFTSLAIVSTLFWSSVWGIVVYTLGDIFLTIFTKYAFLVVLVILGGIFLARLVPRHKGH